MAGTEQYSRWTAKLEACGYVIAEQTLPGSAAAEIVGLVVTIDPNKFRYIDLLHESRHIRQLELAINQGHDPFARSHFARLLRAWFERGAYEYEQRLSQRYDFSSEYRDFLEQQINHSWKRTFRQELRFGQTMRDRLDRIWR